jgi:hypothetical protein
MKSPDLTKLTTEELVRSFRDWSYKQAAAIGDSSNDYAKASGYLMAIGEELRRRGQEARRGLVSLLDCTGTEAGPWKAFSAGAQCRYNAAWQLLSIEPDLARQKLAALAADKISYAGFLARMTLSRLADGSFKPT